MRHASSPPVDAREPGDHAALAEALLVPGDAADFQALRKGTWPDRTAVLSTIDRLHRLLIAETLQASLVNESPERRIERELDEIESVLAAQIRLALEFPARLGEQSVRDDAALDGAGRRLARELLSQLPMLRERVFEDARAAWRGDPSCRHPIEALYAFPGIFAVTRHRIANILYQLDVPLLPRLIAENAHHRTGIDIHPGASIGREFFIDHGTGVVIGETAIVGNRVTLYQGVTLGAKSFPVDAQGRLVKGLARHPIVEDDVTIYAAATVLGRITVGRGSVIGGNVWLTHSVPPNSRVSQAEPLQSGFEHGAGI
ncbi:MAG TPA: serine O-acetyltransferase EpsC [Steroidobacteraceae bacterium]